MVSRRKRLAAISVLAALTLSGCSFGAPSSSTPATNSSRAGSVESAPSLPSSEASSQGPIDESNSPSISVIDSEEQQEPYISLQLGQLEQTEVSVHRYFPAADYYVTVPYEGNEYAFPYPELHNYSGQYHFELTDSETVSVYGVQGACFIRLKYSFGGYFNLKALDHNDELIASLSIQAESTQIGEGVFLVECGDDYLTSESSLELEVGDSLELKATYNGASKRGVFSSSDPSVLTCNGNTIVAASAGAAEIIVTFTATDAKENTYDYGFRVPVTVARTDILTSIALTSEDEIYIVNGEVRYNGDFLASYKDGTSKIIETNDLTFTLGEESEGKRSVTVSYEEGDIEVSKSFSAEIYSASSVQPTEMGFDFRDYYSCYGTGIRTLRLTGNANFLVIPIWFTNSSSFFSISAKEQIREDIEERMFGSGGENGPSVKSFYESESGGALTINGVVAPWYDDSYASTRYNDILNEGYSGELGARAASAYFASHPDDDVSNYDRDGDNKIDGLILFYGANYYGVYENNRSTAFASHFYNAGNGANESLNNLVFTPIGAMYGFTGKTVSSAQKTASDYSMVHPERFQYGSRVTIHEVGHLLGAQDLYYSGGAWHNTQDEESYSPAGSFSMQDNNEGGHDPFTVNSYGWGKPRVYDSSDYELGETLDVYLDDFQSSASSLILTNSWNAKDSPFDEYLNLELYSPTKLNEHDAFASSTAAKEIGLRLWHIDGELEKFNDGKIGYYPEEIGTSFLASNLYDTEEDFHLAHFIRNDEEESYRPKSLFSDSNLFHAGDAFSMEAFASQFKNEGLLDDGSKLGWEFEAKALFNNGDGTFGAVIRLTRVDSTVTEFASSFEFSNDIIGELPCNEEIADSFGLDETVISIRAQDGGGTAPSVGWNSPDFYLALELHNRLEFALQPVEGASYLIKRILISYRMSSTYSPRGVPSLYVDGQSVVGVEHKTYLDKELEEPGYLSTTMEFEVNSSSAFVTNEDIDAKPVWITGVQIEYSIIPNHLLG